MARWKQPVSERFWAKVDKKGPVPEHLPKLGPCWLWTGYSRNWRGYGGIRWGGKEALAHRVAWELMVGPIKNGLCVLHRCDNPPCCNPFHLFLGTRLDNVTDMMGKGRHAKELPTMRGTGHVHAKLTDEDVIQIRAAHERGDILQRETAEKYGVSQVLISRILLRRTWVHLP